MFAPSRVDGNYANSGAAKMYARPAQVMSDRDEDPGADFVPLGSYAVGLEVDSLQAFLESNGIMCFQRGGQVAATLRYGFYDVRLEVRRSDIDKARELETAFNQGLPGYPFRDGGEGTGGELEDDEGAVGDPDDDRGRAQQVRARDPAAEPAPERDDRDRPDPLGGQPALSLIHI